MPGSRLKTVNSRALTSSASFFDGADSFLHGECVLLRIPMPLSLSTDTDAGSPLPPTSRNNSSQHFAFIRSSLLHENGSYELFVYPVVSFSDQGGAIPGYTALDPNRRARLIPLPPLSSDYTPPAFGNPIDLGGFMLNRASWLLTIPYKLNLRETRGFKRWDPKVALSHRQLRQIDNYRVSLLPPPAVQGIGSGNGRGKGGPGTSGSNSGSQEGGGGGGRARGEGTGRRGGSGQRGWRGRRGHGQGWHSRDRGGKEYGEKMGILAKAPVDLSVITEDVDDDPRGATATIKDDLMLLIMVLGDDGSCQKMLDDILKAEATEVQAQSVSKVQDWLQAGKFE